MTKARPKASPALDAAERILPTLPDSILRIDNRQNIYPEETVDLMRAIMALERIASALETLATQRQPVVVLPVGHSHRRR
jgi:hypothetical protein